MTEKLIVELSESHIFELKNLINERWIIARHGSDLAGNQAIMDLCDQMTKALDNAKPAPTCPMTCGKNPYPKG